MAPPPFEPPEARASAEFAGRGLAPLPPSRRGLMAERRTVTAAARVLPADWRATALAALAGTAFGENGEGFLRFSYATSVENIEKGLTRIRDHCRAGS